jgi:hypothetical protein
MPRPFWPHSNLSRPPCRVNEKFKMAKFDRRMRESPGELAKEKLARGSALCDSVSGRSSSTRSCMTFGVIGPARRVRGGPSHSFPWCAACVTGFALPVICASSSSEPGAFSAMTRSSSRLRADRILEGLGRGEPDFGLVGRYAAFAACHRHGAGLHLLVARNADLQGWSWDHSSLAQHGVHRCPEVGEQRRRVPILVDPDPARLMPACVQDSSMVRDKECLVRPLAARRAVP